MMRFDRTERSSEDDGRDTPELALAARIADRAGDDASGAAELPPEEQRTWGRTDDAYRRALDDIALLVDMRRDAPALELVDSPDERFVDEDDLGAAPSSTWGQFEIVSRLGGGASGEVFKARDKHLKNHVALKLFHRERVESVELDALLAEGRQHALVKHPHIAVIHGADEYDGRVGIWMEYIDGATLQDLVQAQGTFGAAEAVNIARELCSAIAAVHQQGLTHGDIKAQNVMREKGSGRIVLMDFSSARHVELDEDASGGLVGTPIYMAPELFDDRPSDFRSDIYALGVLLFYLVTGRHPYEATSLKELREAVATKNPLLLDDLRADLPSDFVRAVHKAITRDPKDRFQSAGEFQAALRDAVDPRLSGGSTTPYGGYEAHAAPDLGVLVRAARVVTWSLFGVGSLAFLGYLNETFYNMVLHVPYRFTNYSLTTATVVGLRSLSFLIVTGVMWAVVLAIGWGLVRLVASDAATRVVNRFLNRCRRIDFAKITISFTLIAMLSVAGSIFVYRGFLDTVGAVGTERDVDFSVLQLACGGEHVAAIGFGLSFSRLVLLLSLGWLLVFGKLNDGRPLVLTARVMKWVGAIAIVVAVGVMTTPWRLLWQNESLPITFGATHGFIVAEDDEDLYVYSPEAASGEKHLVIGRDDPRITAIGGSPEYIFGEEQCGGGDGNE